MYSVSLPSVKGAVEGISRLKQQGHILYIATARTEFMHPDVITMSEQWLSRVFPNSFNRVFYRLNTSKLQTCLDLEADIIVDDNPKVVEECSRYGIRTIVFSCPWNQNQQSSERVHNWQELLEKILS